MLKANQIVRSPCMLEMMVMEITVMVDDDNNNDDGNHIDQQKLDLSSAQPSITQIPSAYTVPQYMNYYEGNRSESSQTLFGERRKDDQLCHNSCKTNVDNQLLRATNVSQRVKSLKQGINATQTSMKERSEAFEGKVNAILTKVEENERMLQMKFFLATNCDIQCCSFNSIHSSCDIWFWETSN